jgi:hypothetical protein
MLKSAAALVVGAVLIGPASTRTQQSTDPIWTTPDRFWYRVTVPGGHEWWQVNAAHGMRERLFDHRRLAIELNQQAKREYSPLQLPFADPAAAFVVKHDGSNAALQEGALAIEFTIEDERWRCELQGEWDWGRTPPSDYYCESQGDSTPADAGRIQPSSVMSPDGKWEATVQNHDVFVRPMGGTYRALSAGGTAVDPYHLGSLRWSSDSQTITAYRVHTAVWRSPPVAGSVKDQIRKTDLSVRPRGAPDPRSAGRARR